jgi:putative peptide zinc metalloprotease protein
VDCEAPEPALEPSRKQEKGGGLLLRIPLFSQEKLLPITGKLHVLFLPGIVIACTALILIGHGAFFFFHAASKSGSLATLSLQQWATLFLLVYLGVFIHELGHASACVRYGAHHGEIGTGIYIIYPVFYCNVTDCWSLPRIKRAVVDIGGLYFQMTFGALCCLIWLWSRNEILGFVIYSNLAGLILNLNPFLKFDGYWLLTDLTGLPSVHQACRDLIKYVYTRARRKAWTGRIPEVFEAPATVRWTIFVYALLSGLFTVYFSLRIALVFVPLVYHTYCTDIPMLVGAALHQQFNKALIGMITRLLFLSISCWGLGRTVVLFAARMLRRIRESQKTTKELQSEAMSPNGNSEPGHQLPMMTYGEAESE